MTANCGVSPIELLRPVEAKLLRAGMHGRQVAEAIGLWTTANQLKTTCELREGRLGYRLIIDAFEEEPALEEWGLITGDFVHNLRSALDNLVFALARLQQDPPARPRSLQFPISADKEKFEANAADTLDQLPPTASATIRSLQPFQRDGSPVTGTPDQDPLLLLHFLSVADKHRVPSVVLVAPNNLEMANSVEFMTDDDAAANTPPDTTVWAGPLTSGTVLLDHRTTAPIKSVKGEFKGQWMVAIEAPRDPAPVGATLQALGRYVWAVVDQFRPLFEG